MKQLHAIYSLRAILLALGTSLALTLFVAAPAAAHTPIITASQDPGGDVRWILPGPRRLDPLVFGTPQNPLGFEPDIGVPISARATTDDGNAFTTTNIPTPHSDKFATVTGSFDASFTDRTRMDRPDSQDSAQAEFRFTDPTGNTQYRVVLKKVIPVGPVHRFFGGVLTNGFLHGTTSVGTRLQPTQFVYAAFWGIAEFFVNDELVSGNRFIHVMTTERVRSSDADGYRLLIDNELQHQGILTHLLLPNRVGTPEGPALEALPTGFVLPNGQEQPFIHLMFEETELVGAALL